MEKWVLIATHHHRYCLLEVAHQNHLSKLLSVLQMLYELYWHNYVLYP